MQFENIENTPFDTTAQIAQIKAELAQLQAKAESLFGKPDTHRFRTAPKPAPITVIDTDTETSGGDCDSFNAFATIYAPDGLVEMRFFYCLGGLTLTKMAVDGRTMPDVVRTNMAFTIDNAFATAYAAVLEKCCDEHARREWEAEKAHLMMLEAHDNAERMRSF